MIVSTPSEMVRAALVLQTSFTARGLYLKTLKKPRKVRPSLAAAGPGATGLPDAAEVAGLPGGIPPNPPVPGVASREPVRPERALISRCGGFDIWAHMWGRLPRQPSQRSYPFAAGGTSPTGTGLAATAAGFVALAPFMVSELSSAICSELKFVISREPRP